MATAERRGILAAMPAVSALSGALDYIKELRDKCQAEGIEAVAAAPAPGRG